MFQALLAQVDVVPPGVQYGVLGLLGTVLCGVGGTIVWILRRLLAAIDNIPKEIVKQLDAQHLRHTDERKLHDSDFANLVRELMSDSEKWRRMVRTRGTAACAEE